MRRRYTRPVPATYWGAWRGTFPGTMHRPYSVPVEAYDTIEETPLQAANSAVVSSAGAARIQIGPQGLGTLWRATMAVVSTTTGANDASTAAIFIGPAGAVGSTDPATGQGGQSYAGGGDSAGLNDALIYPGLYVIAVWASGTSGATATLVVYGRQRALIFPPVMGL